MPLFTGAQQLRHWRNSPGPVAAGIAGSNGTFFVSPLDMEGEPFPGALQANTLGVAMSISVVTSHSNPFTSTYKIGIYTRTGSTLNLVNSASGTWGIAAGNSNSTNSSLYNGARILAISSSQWSSAPLFVPGQHYYAAIQHSTNVHNGAHSYMFAHTYSTVAMNGAVGVNVTNTATSHGLWAPIRGIMSGTTTAVPAVINMTDVTGSGANAAVDLFVRLDDDVRGYA